MSNGSRPNIKHSEAANAQRMWTCWTSTKVQSIMWKWKAAFGLCTAVALMRWCAVKAPAHQAMFHCHGRQAVTGPRSHWPTHNRDLIKMIRLDLGWICKVHCQSDPCCVCASCQVLQHWPREADARCFIKNNIYLFLWILLFLSIKWQQINNE